MQSYCRVFRTVLGIAMLTALAGCGGKKSKGDTTSARAKDDDSGPKFDYEEFAPLPKVMTEVTLPMLLDSQGQVEQSCFATQELEAAVGGFDSKALLEKNSEHVNEVLRRWFIEDVGPASLSMDDAKTWEIEVGNPTVMEVDVSKLRFVENQECIQDETGWLQDGVHAVTTVIGAKFFTFTTKSPINVNTQQDMLETAKEKELTLDSKQLNLYKPALDDKGEQKLTDDGDLIFIGPGGVEVKEKDMPPESERAMKEWTLESPKPIYFAFQEIPSSAWMKENKKKTCDTFLVWGDVTPRAPECEELKNVTFTAEKKDDENLKLEVTYNDKSQELETPYETTQKITLENRIVVWINVKKDDEGVNIRTNSVSIGTGAE